MINMANIENAFLYRNWDINVQIVRGYNNANRRGQKNCKKGTTTNKDQVAFSYHSQLDFSDFFGSDAVIIASGDESKISNR